MGIAAVDSAALPVQAAIVDSTTRAGTTYSVLPPRSVPSSAPSTMIPPRTSLSQSLLIVRQYGKSGPLPCRAAFPTPAPPARLGCGAAWRRGVYQKPTQFRNSPRRIPDRPPVVVPGPPAVHVGCRSEGSAAAVLRMVEAYESSMLMDEILRRREAAGTRWRPGNEPWRKRRSGAEGMSLEQVLSKIGGSQRG